MKLRLPKSLIIAMLVAAAGTPQVMAEQVLISTDTTISSNQWGNYTAKDVLVNPGITLTLSGNDCLRWGDGAMGSLTLAGTDKDHLSTLALGGRQTQTTNIILNGYSRVTSTTAAGSGGNYDSVGGFDTFKDNREGKGQINASGADNIISANIYLRNDLELTVSQNDAEQGELEVSGYIGWRNSQNDTFNGNLIKKGNGTLTISGDNNYMFYRYAGTNTDTNGGLTNEAGSTIFTGAGNIMGDLTISGGSVSISGNNASLQVNDAFTLAESASLSVNDGGTLIINSTNTAAAKTMMTKTTGNGNITLNKVLILDDANATTQATGTLTINKSRTTTDYDFYIGQDSGTRDRSYNLSSFTKVVLGNDAVVKYHGAGSTLNNVTLSEGNASILIRDMKQDTTLNLAGTTDLGNHALTIGATTNNSWKRKVAIESLSGTGASKLVFAGGVTSDGIGSALTISSLQSFSGTIELKEQHAGNPLTATIQTGTGNNVSLKALNFTGTGEVANINVQKDLVIDSVSVNASSEIRQQTTNGGTITIKKLLDGGDNVQLILDSTYARDGKAFTYVIGAADETYNDDNLFSGTLFLRNSDANQGGSAHRAVDLQVKAEDVLKNTVVKLENYASAYNNSRESLSLTGNAKIAGIIGAASGAYAGAGAYIRTGALKVADPSTVADMASTGDAATLEITGAGDYSSNARIMDNVNLLMSGSGSQTFSGNMSDFNGDLTVTNGALKFTAAAPLNFGSVSVKNGSLSMTQVAADKTFAATVGNGARIELGSLLSSGSEWNDKNLIQLTKETGATDMSTVTVVAGGTVAYNTNRYSDAANSTNLNGAKLVLKDGSTLRLRNTADDGFAYQKGGDISTGASAIELEGTTHLTAYSYITAGKTTITDTFTSKAGAVTKLDINSANTKFNMSGNIMVGELAVQAGTIVMKDNTVTADAIKMDSTGVELSGAAKAVVGAATISAAERSTHALMDAVSINAAGIAKNGERAASVSGADISVSKGEYAISGIALSDTKIQALHGDSAAAVTVDGGSIGDNVSLNLKWGASITFLNQVTTINLNDMFIGSGAAVSGYTEGAISEAQEGTIHVVGTLTATDNSKVNANLTFGEGAKLNITGSTGVIMGSAVTFATGNNIQLTGAAADTLASFTLTGQQLTLFSDVDVFNVGGTAYNADELVGTTTTIKDFSSYIDLTDHKYDNVREHLVLKYEVPSDSQQGGAVFLYMETPEPATATLSLLALAALAARRRRK